MTTSHDYHPVLRARCVWGHAVRVYKDRQGVWRMAPHTRAAASSREREVTCPVRGVDAAPLIREWLNREVGYSERAVQSCATARDRAIQVLEETTTKLLRAVETATTIKTLASEFPCPTPPPVQPTPTP